jgi:hypothetical protein
VTEVLTGPRVDPTPRPSAVGGWPQLSPPAWPWLVGDVLGVSVANIAGLGLLLTGLQGTRHTADPHTLLLLLNVAAAGLVVALAGNAVFLLTGLRQVGRLRTELLGAEPAWPDAPEVVDPAPVTGRLVAASNMSRFHRAECPSVVGKPVVEAGLAAHLAAGRLPCGLCAAPAQDAR